MSFETDGNFEIPSKTRIYLLLSGVALLCLLPILIFGLVRSPVATEFRYNEPLSVAVKNNDFAAVEKYLSLGASPNVNGPTGEPLIFLAASLPSTSLFHLLIDRGADISVTDKNGMNPFMHAVQKNDPALIQKFLTRERKPGDLEQKSHSGWTALLYAVEDQGDESAQLLLASGANPNVQDMGGNTPLMYAVRRRNERLAKLLISQGALVNTKNSLGLTALDYAEAQKHEEILELLKSHKAKTGLDLP